MNVQISGTQLASAGATGSDIGSSMIIIFTEHQWRVIVGHSSSDHVWKFPCGKIEGQDTAYGLSPLEELPLVARRCVLRELKAEVGLTAQDLLLVHQLAYVRTWTKQDYLTHHKKVLRQFHFLGMMKEGVLLQSHVEEQEEMDKRAYWSVEEVLRQSLQPRYSQRKFNPYHAIALTEALRFLQSSIGSDPAFEKFHTLLHSLKKQNIHLDTLGMELNDLIVARKI